MSGETRKTIICLIGLGSFCTMFRAPFFGTLTMNVAQGFSNLRMTYDFALIVLGVALALYSLWQTRKGSSNIWSSGRLLPYAIAGFLEAIGILAVNVGRVLQVQEDAYFLANIIVMCIGFAALAVGWFRVLISFPRKRIAAVVMASFVVSHVWGLFDMLPQSWMSWFNVIYPLISIGTLMLLGRERLGAPAEDAEPLLKSSYLRKVQIFTLVLVFAELLCGAFLRGRWAHGGVGYSASSTTIYSYLVSLAVGVVFWLIARKARSTAECTLLIGGLGLVGFMVSVLMLAFMDSGVLAGRFVTGLYSALLVYLMALISLWGIDDKRSFVQCGALFLVLFAVAGGIATTIIPGILMLLNLTPAEFLAPTLIAAGMVISLAMCVALFIMVFAQRELFTARLKQSLQEQEHAAELAASAEEALSSEERHERAMDLIADEYLLTDRERATASLMARGYTAARVAEELTVAVSTIQGYSKTIYRKMDIHSKDELIAIVTEAKERI